MGRTLELITASALLFIGCTNIPKDSVKTTHYNCTTCDFPTAEMRSGRTIYGYCQTHFRYSPRGFIDCDKTNDLVAITYFATGFELTRNKKEKFNSAEAYVFDNQTGSWRFVGYFDLPFISKSTDILFR
jgi:hypothetical protein